ncbi:hypothetical protein bcgnr5390_43740 [Bacillus luti]
MSFYIISGCCIMTKNSKLLRQENLKIYININIVVFEIIDTYNNLCMLFYLNMLWKET